MTQQSHDLVSAKALLGDIIASVLVLLGAAMTEGIKHLFFPAGDIPAIVNVLLTVSEITLLIGFIAVLVHAATILARELDTFTTAISRTAVWNALSEFWRGQAKPITWQGSVRALSYGMITTFFVVVLSIATLLLEPLSTAFLIVGVVAVLLVIVIGTIKIMSDMGPLGSGIAMTAPVIFLIMVLPIFFLIGLAVLIIRATGLDSTVISYWNILTAK